MAVVSVDEQFDRRRSFYRNGTMSHVRAFLVKCDDVDDGTQVAIAANGVPKPGDFLLPPGVTTPDPDTIYPVVSTIDADPWQNSSDHFQVLVQYDTVPIDTNSPLDEPAEVAYSYDTSTEDWFVDYSTPPKRFTNSSGETFSSLFQRETGILVITVTKNVASFNAIQMDALKDTINNANVVIDGTTYAAGTLLMKPPTATKQTAKVNVGGVEQTITYYKQVLVVKATHKGWDLTIDDVGTKRLVQVPAQNGKPAYTVTAAIMQNGAPINEPWPLDGNGQPKANITDTPAQLTFKPYPRVDWSGLAFS